MTDVTYNSIPVVNPTEHSWNDGLYLMWAGAYGDVRCYVWADSFDTAFECLVEYLDDHAPGCLSTIDYEGYLGPDPEALSEEAREAAIEEAEMDMTVVGHTTLQHGNAIPSWEWGGDEIHPDDESYTAIKLLC